MDMFELNYQKLRFLYYTFLPNPCLDSTRLFLRRRHTNEIKKTKHSPFAEICLEIRS